MRQSRKAITVVTIKCQHSGIEFEAQSKRTKQHPRVAKLKTDAHRDGNYRQMCDALDKIQKDGGYATIEEYVQLVKDRIVSIKAKRDARILEQRKADKQRKQSEKVLSAWLKENGYEYREVFNPRGLRGSDAFEVIDDPSFYDHLLYAPDDEEIGRYDAQRIMNGELSIEQFRTEEFTKAHEAALIEKAEREEKESKEKAWQDATDAFDAQVKEIEQANTCVSVDWQDYPESAEVISKHGCSRDTIKVAEINGVKVYCINTGAGSDSFSGYSSYYCGDPAVAGFNPVVQIK